MLYKYGCISLKRLYCTVQCTVDIAKTPFVKKGGLAKKIHFKLKIN